MRTVVSNLTENTPHWPPGNDANDNSRLWEQPRYEGLCHTQRAGRYALANRDRWQLQCRNYWTLVSDAVWPIPYADQNAQSQRYSWGRHWIPSPWLRIQLNNTNNYARVTIKQELSRLQRKFTFGFLGSPSGKLKVQFFLLTLWRITIYIGVVPHR